MFLKLFDDTATMKLVNIGLAQSIEKYEPEKELSAKELKETKNIPEILKKGIRVIWNDRLEIFWQHHPIHLEQSLCHGIQGAKNPTTCPNHWGQQAIRQFCE